MKNTDDFLIAHIELEKAHFANSDDLGIEFKNEIDAWARMEVRFRHQIRNPQRKPFKGKQDLAPYRYSIRHKLDS